MTRAAPKVAQHTVSRRTVLEWLGAGLVLALGGELGARAATLAGSPAERFPFRPGSRAAALFTQWGVRTVDRQELQGILAAWQLEVTGLVARPTTLSFGEVLALPRTEQVTDFHCVEGWSVYDVPWTGVRLSDLLDRVEPLPEATHVHFHTLGGTYNESLPLAVAREPRTLLGYGAAGSTLPLEHGFPLRVVVPRLLGYKNAKYVYRVELAAKRLDGYWVRAGYDYVGAVPEGRLRAGKY